MNYFGSLFIKFGSNCVMYSLWYVVPHNQCSFICYFDGFAWRHLLTLTIHVNSVKRSNVQFTSIRGLFSFRCQESHRTLNLRQSKYRIFQVYSHQTNVNKFRSHFPCGVQCVGKMWKKKYIYYDSYDKMPASRHTIRVWCALFQLNKRKLTENRFQSLAYAATAAYILIGTHFGLLLQQQKGNDELEKMKTWCTYVLFDSKT